MSRSTVRVCSRPGCPELSEQGGLCDAHRVEVRRRADTRRPKTAARGLGAPHQRLKAALVAEARQAGGAICPECDRPIDLDASGRHPRGAVLDHVVPRSRGGRGGRANARLVCRECSDRQGGELGGFGRAAR